MSAPFRYDPEDPFGSRADEKPPDGWQEGFWDEVRGRIERQSSGQPTDPPPRSPGARRPAATVVALLLLAATLLGLARRNWRTVESIPAPADPSTTHVRVNGSERPDVAVEWARTDGADSGYVVLRSIDPDIAWVVLETRGPEGPR